MMTLATQHSTTGRNAPRAVCAPEPTLAGVVGAAARSAAAFNCVRSTRRLVPLTAALALDGARSSGGSRRWSMGGLRECKRSERRVTQVLGNVPSGQMDEVENQTEQLRQE